MSKKTILLYLSQCYNKTEDNRIEDKKMCAMCFKHKPNKFRFIFREFVNRVKICMQKFCRSYLLNRTRKAKTPFHIPMLYSYLNFVQNTRFSLFLSLTIFRLSFKFSLSALSFPNASGQCILNMCCIIQLLHNNLNASNRNGSRNYNSGENFDIMFMTRPIIT